jgi:hypothetical protein
VEACGLVAYWRDFWRFISSEPPEVVGDYSCPTANACTSKNHCVKRSIEGLLVKKSFTHYSLYLLSSKTVQELGPPVRRHRWSNDPRVVFCPSVDGVVSKDSTSGARASTYIVSRLYPIGACSFEACVGVTKIGAPTKCGGSLYRSIW